jgi:hypothetical protein
MSWQKTRVREKILPLVASLSTYSASGTESLSQAQVGYDLRQPLNSGVNTIHYLQYLKNFVKLIYCTVK